MGRPPSNGGPSFRFNPTEVTEMQGVLQAHDCVVPQREILEALAEKFSNSAERSGKPAVQMKQVWNWFQNRRHALKSKSGKPPVKSNESPVVQHDLATARSVSQAPKKPSVPAANATNVPQVPQSDPTPPVQSAGRNSSNNSQMEFEAKSARDGAWYDVATFLSHRSMETTDPEVLVRFAGFGSEEDEWVNAQKHVRQRSLPCESSECVAVLPGDLILCFQEGKEQALYFDAHVLDAQRRRHDVRGCRCRFLVRYDHDQSEEIVPLRKICRRPETDYRMRQLHAESVNMKQNKTISEPHTYSLKTYLPAEATLKQSKVEGPAETIPILANAEGHAYCNPLPTPISHANIPITTSMAPIVHSIEPLASAITPGPHSNVSLAPTTAPEAKSGVPGPTIVAPFTSNVPLASTAAAIANSSIHGAITIAPVASNVPLAPSVAPVANSSVPGSTIASSVSVAPAPALVANSSVHISPNMAPAANSSVPIAPTMAPASNSSVTIASTAEAAFSNSSVPGAMTAEAPVATNSSVPWATSEAPVASDVPGGTEIKVLLEKVSVSCIADNVGNMDAQHMNLARASGTDTSAVPEVGRGE